MNVDLSHDKEPPLVLIFYFKNYTYPLMSIKAI
jgi:hypothetical protein